MVMVDLGKRHESGLPGALIKMHIHRPHLELTESHVRPGTCVLSTCLGGSAATVMCDSLWARSSIRATLEIQPPAASGKLQEAPLTFWQGEYNIETKDENQ